MSENTILQTTTPFGDLNIRQQDLINALQQAMEHSDDSDSSVMTSRELSKALKLHRDTINELIRELSDLGMIEVVKIPRRRIDGAMQLVPGYKLITQEAQNGSHTYIPE